MIYKISEKYNIDTSKLKTIETQYSKKIISISWKSLTETDLKNSFNKRLSKYKRRLSEDLKIKLKKIEPEYEKWLNNILHYFVNINTHFDVKDLKKVHNIFYPKNIWWDTKAPNWQLYLKEYKSWFIREHREFVTVNNNNYEYFHPREIESSLKNLILWYKQDKDTSIFLKAIVFYIIFCEIHPFYNWNWTIWLLFTDFILKTNGYDFEVIDFLDKVVNLEL